MRGIVFVTLLLFCAHHTFSQSDFRSGFIVTNERDTVHGLLDYTSGRKSNTVCYYKKALNSETTTFTPEQLAGYGFDNDKVFVTMALKPGRLIFLEVIVNGIVSLYRSEGVYYVNKNGS